MNKSDSKHIKNLRSQKTPNASATSKCITSASKRGKGADRRKKPVQTRVKPFSDVIHNDVAIASRVSSFRAWRSVVPLLRYLKRKRFNVNAVLNRALLFYLRVEVDDDWLRDEARLQLLLREERRLIQLNRVMLRSGAYLDLYADKVLKGGSRENREAAKLGRKPLGALAPNEVPVFRRMVARREAVVGEIKEILARRLPEAEYVLKEDRPRRRRSWSRRRDKKGNMERS